MIKRTILLSVTILTILISFAFSQSQILIRSSKDTSALPFATVFSLLTNSYYSANEIGFFETSPGTEHLYRISYIGYEDLNYISNSSKLIDTLYLVSKVLSLKEVVVRNCKVTKEETISNFTNDKQRLFGGIMCTKGQTNGKVAVHVKANEVQAKLVSLSFWLNRLSYMPGYAIKSPLSISFYSYSESTKLPDDLLYDKPLFYHPKKNGKQTIRTDSLNIDIPNDGIYVSFEFIMDEKYQWEQKVNDSLVINQGVHIAGSNSEQYELAFFDYKTNNWNIAKPTRASSDNLHGTIKIEIVYQYCND